MIWLNGLILAAALAAPQPAAYRLNQEGDSLLRQARYAEAIPVFRAAVSSAEATLGADHPATAMMMRNLALACAREGYYHLAEHSAKQSLAILEARFGPGDVTLVPALNALAEAYIGTGRTTEARKALLRAIAIGPEAGPHYATALHNLGAVYQSEGRLRKAQEFYSAALTAFSGERGTEIGKNRQSLAESKR
jgi:tetratricopeptide (TPR) repeat protein